MAMFSKQKSPNSPWNLADINMNLPASPGMQVSSLPGIPQLQPTQAPQVPQFLQQPPKQNQNLLALLSQLQTA